MDKLQGISGYERVGTDNFQPRLGGNVDMLIGNDLLELHPTDITYIHDGLKVIHHRARLHNPDHFRTSLFPGNLGTGSQAVLMRPPFEGLFCDFVHLNLMISLKYR